MRRRSCEAATSPGVAGLRSALEALVEPTTREKGYVNDDVHQSLSDPGVFFFENCESEAHLEAHLAGAAPGSPRRSAR